MILSRMLYFASKPVVGTYTDTMLQMNVRFYSKLPDGPKIIAANHPSTTDPFFVASMIRQQAFILINNVLFQVPVLGEYLRRSGHIPVKAGEGQQAVDTAIQRLKEGRTVIIFPEGALSPAEGGFQSARTGVGRLALASGAPVIPVGIHLVRDRCRVIRSTVSGKDEYGRWYLQGPYHVTAGNPIYYSGDVEDRPRVRAVSQSVMHHIIELAHESEERYNQRHPINGMPSTTF